MPFGLAHQQFSSEKVAPLCTVSPRTTAFFFGGCFFSAEFSEAKREERPRFVFCSRFLWTRAGNFFSVFLWIKSGCIGPDGPVGQSVRAH